MNILVLKTADEDLSERLSNDNIILIAKNKAIMQAGLIFWMIIGCLQLLIKSDYCFYMISYKNSSDIHIFKRDSAERFY